MPLALCLIALFATGEGAEPSPDGTAAPTEDAVVVETVTAAPAGDPVAGEPATSAPVGDSAAAESVTAVPTVSQPIDGEGAPLRISAAAQLRTLAIGDVDPSNDTYVVYKAGASYRFKDKLKALASLTLTERFVREPSETGFSLGDLVLSATYDHSATLPAWNIAWLGGRELSLTQRLNLYLPTSDDSRDQALVFAPEAKSTVATEVLPGLTAGTEGWFQYRWHRYAERQGPGGTPLTRFVLGLAAFAEYEIFEHATYGKWSASADVYTFYAQRHGSRETYDGGSLTGNPVLDDFFDPADLSGDPSSRAPWNQGYGWDLAVTYTPTQADWLTATLALEHGARLLRGGVVNTFVFKREDTEVALGVSARF